MGPVDLSVWNPGQNTVFLVIVMVVLSQFLHKTGIVGHLDCFRDFELPPLFSGREEVEFVEGQGRFIIIIT